MQWFPHLATGDCQSSTCCSTSRSTNICRWSWANATCIATVRIFWEQFCQRWQSSCSQFSTGLVLYSDGYFDGYDPSVNPGAGKGCHKHSKQTNKHSNRHSKQTNIFCAWKTGLVPLFGTAILIPLSSNHNCILANNIGRSSFHNSCLQIRTLPSTVHHRTMVNKVLLLLINKTTNLF